MLRDASTARSLHMDTAFCAKAPLPTRPKRGNRSSCSRFVCRVERDWVAGSRFGPLGGTFLEKPNNGQGFGPQISMDDLSGTMQTSEDPLWDLVRTQALTGARNEPPLASFLFSSILNHGNLNDSVAYVLAEQLATGYFQATQWLTILQDAMKEDPSYGRSIRSDLVAAISRDPAQRHAVGVLLNSKGLHALESYRLAHRLWKCGRTGLALYLQSMISNKFSVDIHPGAIMGDGVFLDHATGLVVGETATVGDNCSILQYVTLGGTGKEGGDRHPKIGNGVLIGAGATVLGNIKVGNCAKISPGSVVLKPVEPFTLVSGVPAKPRGRLTTSPALDMDHKLTSTEDDDAVWSGL
eukprot:Plantae.Rhodophyta-Rhodochaete_pulchella.ctg3081.p1 GENE.Plantae.Rhodophyta-Rhodochaete_pulchella.ctg3081~~Plantae.Rhodophyta-Rhodochaete_pulchella.ctg3081.p1  ORF type:complete len:353 (-),score=30.05 Plantae.Rhodophyta-Rhodochaete_pulchella.ctg3081:231-1289(-)